MSDTPSPSKQRLNIALRDIPRHLSNEGKVDELLQRLSRILGPMNK